MSLLYTHAIVYKPDLSLLKTKAAKYDSLIKSLSRDEYAGGNIGNRLSSTAESLVPKAGMSGVATITPMMVGGVLANAAIEFDIRKIVQSLPGRILIGNMVIQNTVYTVMLTQQSILKLRMCICLATKGIKTEIRTLQNISVGIGKKRKG